MTIQAPFGLVEPVPVQARRCWPLKIGIVASVSEFIRELIDVLLIESAHDRACLAIVMLAVKPVLGRVEQRQGRIEAQALRHCDEILNERLVTAKEIREHPPCCIAHPKALRPQVQRIHVPFEIVNEGGEIAGVKREMCVSERLVERVAASAVEIKERGDQAVPRVSHKGELEIGERGALHQASERLVTMSIFDMIEPAIVIACQHRQTKRGQHGFARRFRDVGEDAVMAMGNQRSGRCSRRAERGI